MNIAFDADGVIYDTELFQLKHAIYFKEKYNMKVINENGYGVKEIFNCTDEQEKDFWTKHAIKYSLFFKPRKDAAETIKKLRSEGNKVHIITSKGRALEKGIGALVRFLFETGLKRNGIEVDGIHYCSIENSAADKVEKCRELKIDIMIEDKKENVVELSNVTNVLCMNTRNNQNCEGNNITRVYNFNDVYTEIKKIEDDKKNTTSIFTTHKLLSKEEKFQLSNSQLREYYIKLREYYLSLPFDEKGLVRSEKNFKIVSKVIGSVFNFKYHPQIINEKLIPNSNGVIFVSNHLSNKDSMLLLTTLKDYPWHPLGKIKLSEGAIGLLHDSIITVYVDRKNQQSRRESVGQMAKILLNGGNVLIFPEGTQNKTENNLISFAGVSAVYLSQALDKYIVPMALTNTYGEAEKPIVRIGEPIKVSIDENLNDANDKLWHTMSDLVEENKQLVKTMHLSK